MIKGQDKEWMQFIQNRVCEIRILLLLNVRDIVQVLIIQEIYRMDPQELKSGKFWFSGPKWLCEVGTQGKNRDVLMPAECLTEIKTKHHSYADKCGLDKIMKYEDYSTLVITTLVLKFVKCLKR